MSNEERREHYELFVLGVAEEDAAAEIRGLLAANDPETVAGVAAARTLVSAFADFAPEVEPPERLRRRIRASVERESAGFPRWVWAWAAATALLALVTFNFWQREQRKNEELAQVREELVRQGGELAQVRQLLDFLNEPQLRLSSFGQTQPAPPRGRVLVSPTRGALLLVNNLPPAAQGRIYQMWFVPKSGAPVSAGLFQTTPQGTAIYVRSGAVDIAGTAAVAVSVEPESGSPAPSTTPIIVAPLAE
ncbi:MAG: anti-sigma factor [Bryobacteraceae bacterium]|nr:anti-sigma factor [Bryobacteraceae bacterium]